MGIILSALVTAAIASAAPSRPILFDEVYVPTGYDSNDNVQIMAEGLLPDTCWQLADTPFKVDLDNHVIHIYPHVVQVSEICQPVMRPVQALIQIGKLPPGSYAIVQGNEEAPVGGLKIAAALSDTVDDHQYAPVSDVLFQSAMMGSGIMLTGQFPSSCMKLEEIPISIEDHVIVVKPIVSTKEGSDCHGGSFPFKATTYLDYVKEGRYLLQVRTMNGQAVNRIVDIH